MAENINSTLSCPLPEQFTNSNLVWLDFLEKLVATYEKNKSDVHLGFNLKEISSLTDIKVPELIISIFFE